MEHFKDALNKYAQFTGRATREQFWMYVLFYFIFVFAAVMLDVVIGIELISTLLSLALLIPSISVTARRLHDTGRTGWWQLIGIIPLIGLIVMIVFTVQDSQGDNEYGPNPKAAV